MTEPATTLPRIGILLPEGWVRLRFDGTIDAQVTGLVAAIVARLDPQRRDLARVQLRRWFGELVQRAGDSAYELWMPVAPTGGVSIPVSVTVAPPPRVPDPARTAGEHLTAFAASAGDARLGEIGGRPAVRIAVDVAGEKDAEGRWTAFPRRRITALVSPAGDDGWLVFLAEIVVPEQDPDEIVAACEFFVDAFLRTVSFPGGGERGLS